MDAFHRERRIPVRRGRSRHEVKQIYIRFCFLDAGSAEALRNRFGGERQPPGRGMSLRTGSGSTDAPTFGAHCDRLAEVSQ
jgi:hypothetical protein